MRTKMRSPTAMGTTKADSRPSDCASTPWPMHTGATWKSASAVCETASPLVDAGADCAPSVGIPLEVVEAIEEREVSLLELGGGVILEDAGGDEEGDRDIGGEEVGGNEPDEDGGP